MKIILNTIALFLALTFTLTAQKVTVLPIPQKVSAQQSTFRIDRKFNFDLSSLPSLRIQNAVKRLQINWEKKTLQKVTNSASKTNDLLLLIDSNWKGSSNSLEEYELQISNMIQIKAKTEIGLFHGLETLAQLIQSDAKGYFLPLLTISDWPRFERRGLMIDVARHFIPLDQVLRSLDALAASKMNVLHLHLSDDEGFRVESKVYPQLHLKGSNGEFFTQEEIKEIVDYAADRGIEVIPEFDLPGHSQSWFVGHPELASEKKEYKIGPRFIIEEGKPMNMMAIMQLMNSQATPTINPAEEKTYQFIEKLFKEMTSLYPSPYIHIGMDENNGVAWKNNPQIQAFMKRKNIPNEHELQAYFGDRLNKIVNKLGKSTIVWEDAFHPAISSNITIQLWKPALMGKVLQVGEVEAKQNKTIISRGFYLDYFMPSAFHYMNLEILNLKSDEGVLGGEAAIWSELVDKNNFELRIWPRTIAVAARLWSSKDEQNVDQFYDLLPAFDRHLTSIGLKHHAQSESHLKTLLNGDLNDMDRQFFGLVAPVKGFKRLMGLVGQPTVNQFSHFNQFADALPSDSFLKWEFRKMVKEYLQDQSNLTLRGKIMEQLALWIKLNTYLEQRSNSSVHLQKVLPMVKQLSLCSQLIYDKLNLNNPKSDSQILAEISKLSKMNVAELECVIAVEFESLVSGKLKDLDLKMSLF